MSKTTSAEDFLEAEIESGIAPYRAQGYSPALLLEMEKLLRMALTTHPTGRYLMSRVRPREVQESGTSATEHADGAVKTGSSR